MTEVYFSVDIESDGPLPGPNSMLSLGAAAFNDQGVMLDTFSGNLKSLPQAKPDPRTMSEFWDKNPEAWKAATENAEDPAVVMKKFSDWVTKTSGEGRPAFVGYPAGYDFTFIYWYLVYFTGNSPFSFSAIDIKTYAMAMLKTQYRASTKRNMPKRWFPATRHTHVAVEDAVEQGLLFMNMLKENVQK